MSPAAQWVSGPVAPVGGLPALSLGCLGVQGALPQESVEARDPHCIGKNNKTRNILLPEN